MKRICGNCRFFCDNESNSECRRLPITHLGFPSTRCSFWCGEFQPVEIGKKSPPEAKSHPPKLSNRDWNKFLRGEN